MIGRSLPTATRADLLKGTSSNALIGYIRILSPRIAGGVNYVSDVVAHTVDGVTYEPIGDGIATPAQDDARSPRQTFVLPDIDRKLNKALRTDTAAMTASVFWYTAADLDLAVTPRAPVSGAVPLVAYSGWRVIEVGDAGGGSITLTIERRNIDQEVIGLSADAQTAPGLHP